ncbi:TetR family transcriptional regulator C-terminal domain-containing protein [Nonomuraea sp. NPDC050310]|uniref:TetR/AcrR family transcriptional regulator n=1 Tax=unclassified Nonomuraea TaxID=2593643 RepID=UPI0033F9FD4C
MTDGRRTQERGRQARRQVLEAALAVIAELPVAELQVQQIAERAGMSPARVLYYFQSRDQILTETFRWSERVLAERRARELAAAGGPKERLAAFIRVYLPVDRHDVTWKLWLEAWLRSMSAAEMGRTAEEIDGGWKQDLVTILEEGDFRPAPEFLDWFLPLLDGLAVHVLIGRLEPAEAAEVALGQALERLS